MLAVLRRLSLFETIDYIVTWEQKPKLTFNRYGNLEYENPQELYGCTVTFWDEDGKEVSRTKYIIKEDE